MKKVNMNIASKSNLQIDEQEHTEKTSIFKPKNTLIKPNVKSAKKESINELNLQKKKLKELNKRRSTRSKIPKSAQSTIPYIADYDGGIFEISKNKYNICLDFNDINYHQSREEEQMSIFSAYCQFINYFSPDVELQLIINNQNIDIDQLKKDILLTSKNDDLNDLRDEYNTHLLKQVNSGKNNLRKFKHIVITIEANTILEASSRFDRMELEIIDMFQKIGSSLRRQSTTERLEVLHDVFRPNEIGNFAKGFDYDKVKYKSVSTKDYISPPSFKFDKNHLMIGNRYARCLFLNNLPTVLSDKVLSDITDCNFNMLCSLNIHSFAPQEAIKLVARQITKMESNKIEQQKKAMKAGYDPSMINRNLKRSLEEAEELQDDILNKNQKLFNFSFVMMLIANSKQELEQNTETISSICRINICEAQVLSHLQEDAFKQALPLGNNLLSIKRTLTTESTAVFIPFQSSELFQKRGMYYGLNNISKNLIMFNRTNLKNPNGFILGVPGSGKSFSSKREMVNVLLNSEDAEVIVIDPEREYSALANEFGGEIINISASSNNYVNPFEMVDGYDEKNPLEFKMEFLYSFFGILIADNERLSNTEKSLVFRVAKIIYEKFFQTNNNEDLPTLIDFYNTMKKQEEKEAKKLSIQLEIYLNGNFSHKSNVDLKNRFTVFDIKDLGRNLKTVGLLVALDTAWNRIAYNRSIGKETWLYIDEIYLLFNNEFSANYLYELWKRARKWGCIPTGITQNVEDMLRSDLARSMISNSEYLYILNQAHSDLMELSGMLSLSESQMGYLRTSDKGQGLLKAGNSIIPFIDHFPKDTRLYELMNTNPKELNKRK